MRRALLPLIALALMLGAAHPALAQSKKVCSGQTCTQQEVGMFMEGVDAGCYNLGNCGIGDMIIVIENAGNFVLAIIGAVVLLMYVIGGIYMLSAGGNQERISKGKNYLKTSTIGLLIVLGAGLFINTLNRVLRGEDLGVGEYAVCTADNAGAACGDKRQCVELEPGEVRCRPLCEIEALKANETGESGVVYNSACLTDAEAAESSFHTDPIGAPGELCRAEDERCWLGS